MKIHPDMMRGDEIPDRVMQVHEKLTFFAEREISPAPYFRILLSGEGFNDDLDPDHVAQPITTTYYYPGAMKIAGMDDGHKRLTFHDLRADFTEQDMDIQGLREKLKGLRVGAEALKRFNDSPSGAVVSEIKGTHASVGLDPLDVAVQMTAAHDLPIAGVEFRKILTHRSAKPGDSLAILTSFGLVHPVRALRLVQKSIIDDESAETL